MKCSHTAAQAAPKAGGEPLCGFEGKSSCHFCICCFLKTKSLALVVSQWEQLAVSFFTVLQGNILQVCTSNLGQKVSKATWLAEDSLGWEDKTGRRRSVSTGRQCDSLVWLAVALQTEKQCSRWLSWEWKGFCRELKSDFLYGPQLCSHNCRRHLHALHHFFFPRQ